MTATSDDLTLASICSGAHNLSLEPPPARPVRLNSSDVWYLWYGTLAHSSWWSRHYFERNYELAYRWFACLRFLWTAWSSGGAYVQLPLRNNSNSSHQCRSPDRFVCLQQKWYSQPTTKFGKDRHLISQKLSQSTFLSACTNNFSNSVEARWSQAREADQNLSWEAPALALT